MRRSASVQRRCAFTLVELLAVIAVLGLVVALVIPAMGRYLSAYRLNHVGQGLIAELARARMHATTAQRTAALRLYQLPKGDGSTEQVYRMVQVMEYPREGGAARPVGRALEVIEPVAFNEALSSLLTNDGVVRGTTTFRGTDDVPFAEILIYPNGTTSLIATSPHPYLTLTTAHDSPTEPVDPLVISVDPVTSSFKVFRR